MILFFTPLTKGLFICYLVFRWQPKSEKAAIKKKAISCFIRALIWQVSNLCYTEKYTKHSSVLILSFVYFFCVTDVTISDFILNLYPNGLLILKTWHISTP